MISTTDQYGFSKSIPINKLANYKCKLILADKLAFSTDTIERIGESCAEKYSNANEWRAQIDTKLHHFQLLI